MSAPLPLRLRLPIMLGLMQLIGLWLLLLGKLLMRVISATRIKVLYTIMPNIGRMTEQNSPEAACWAGNWAGRQTVTAHQDLKRWRETLLLMWKREHASQSKHKALKTLQHLLVNIFRPIYIYKKKIIKKKGGDTFFPIPLVGEGAGDTGTKSIRFGDDDEDFSRSLSLYRIKNTI